MVLRHTIFIKRNEGNFTHKISYSFVDYWTFAKALENLWPNEVLVNVKETSGHVCMYEKIIDKIMETNQESLSA